LATYDEATAKANRAAEAEAKFNAAISEGAVALEMTEDALEGYANALIKANDQLEENSEIAAQVAVYNYKLAKGLKELRTVFGENIKTVRDANANTLEYYEALGAIEEQFEKTFGTEVSSTFIEDNLSLID
jgi:hypothetical protein